MIIINPGSGPVADATLDQARENMNTFVADLMAAGHESAAWSRALHMNASQDRNGRFSFSVHMVSNGIAHEHEISMPGVPLDRVRWLGEESGNIWDFPRLYVDGSSWIWAFALGACR